MKFSADRAAFAAAAKTVSAHVGKRSHLPVLSGVRVDAGTDGLHLTCTDLDTTCTVYLAGHVMDAGTFIVPAAALTGFVAAGTAGEVQVVEEDAQVVVGCGTARARLPLLPVNEWPRIGHADTEGAHVDAGKVGLLAKVLHAASTEDNRPILNGVQIGNGKAVATDSHRLAAVDIEGIPEGLIPARALHAVCRQADGGIDIAADKRSVTFTAGNTRWTTSTIAGDYPKWQSLVRADSPHHLTVDRDELLGVLRRVTTIAANFHIVVLALVDGELVVTRDVQDVGRTEDILDADGTWPGRIGFNAVYLDDLLDACDPGPITFETVDSLKPLQMRQGPLFQLLMPHRLA